MELPASVTESLVSRERLEVLQSVAPDMRVLDAEFDTITQIAADLFRAPVALVSLLDPHTQWFKARVGTEETHASSLESFCAHTIADSHGALVVSDASADPRFANQPRVSGAPFLRFYAGVPVFIEDQPIGTVCVFDIVARPQTDPKLVEQLHRLSALASSLFKLKDEARKRALKEVALSRDSRRHAMALDAANVGSWLWDIRTGNVSGNGAMLRLFDLPTTGAQLRARDIFLLFILRIAPRRLKNSVLPWRRMRSMTASFALSRQIDGYWGVAASTRGFERQADGVPRHQP
ncbi:GAF domain-containing protein [Rhizobium sp. 32-5/1]|uniref:GAF domain-containing protein n=1 Tax=Rhizobium sp. 32-5/1 TaxID=3019602 RepID=UPI00240D2F02|nr:GAF domain-containing protein [Rhizobium sp. 32-5/1]WEZ82821.1 GAF domain-containing protein [Rhizobium sp. 32-5/1]